jgi:hypothetical protein
LFLHNVPFPTFPQILLLLLLRILLREVLVLVLRATAALKSDDGVILLFEISLR